MEQYLNKRLKQSSETFVLDDCLKTAPGGRAKLEIVLVIVIVIVLDP
jgi:hypothetical protein